MPRLSVESKGALVWQTKGEHPKAPRDLSREARKLWKSIVESRPVDFFRPGSLSLLEQLCEVLVAAHAAQIQLRDNPTNPDTIAAMRSLSLVSIQLATKLRLTVQEGVHRKSRKLDEEDQTGSQPWKLAA